MKSVIKYCKMSPVCNRKSDISGHLIQYTEHKLYNGVQCYIKTSISGVLHISLELIQLSIELRPGLTNGGGGGGSNSSSLTPDQL